MGDVVHVSHMVVMTVKGDAIERQKAYNEIDNGAFVAFNKLGDKYDGNKRNKKNYLQNEGAEDIRNSRNNHQGSCYASECFL